MKKEKRVKKPLQIACNGQYYIYQLVKIMMMMNIMRLVMVMLIMMMNSSG